MTLEARIAAASAAVRDARNPAEEAAAESALAALLAERDTAKYGAPPQAAARNPSTSSGDWEPPVSFDATGDLPAFPTDALPGPVAAWVRAEAEATQTPEDLPGMIALSVLSTTVAKKVRALIRQGWVESLNTYNAVTLPPGERKSAVFRDATAPVLDWEREATEQAAPLLREATIAFEFAEGRLKDAKARAIRAKGTDRAVAEEEVRRLSEEAAALPRPVLPRLLADDVTPERMFGILAEQGGRLAILSAEGGLFDLLAGRYSDGLPNLDAFLKAHSGDQLRVDRIGRPPEHLREPVLTVGLTVQPIVITGLADRPGFRGRGLLARFLYSLPRSKVGHRLVDPPPVRGEVTAAYAATVRALLDLPADRGEDGEIVSRELPFSPEAVQALLRFSADLEPRLAEGGDLEPVRDWAAKLPGAVARIAGLLALADQVNSGDCGNSGNLSPFPWADQEGHSGDCGNSGNPSQGSSAPSPPSLEAFEKSFGTPSEGSSPSPVPEEAVERAIALGHYLIPHALAAFGLMGARKEVEDAKYLLRWVLKTNSEKFTKREAWQGTKGRFEKAEDLETPLEELEARGYVRRQPDDPREGPGRRPSPTYLVNPLAHGRAPTGERGPGVDQGSHNSQNPQNRSGAASPGTIPPSQNSQNPHNATGTNGRRHQASVSGSSQVPVAPTGSAVTVSHEVPATPGHAVDCDCAECIPLNLAAFADEEGRA